jgi:hypothetical protein
MPPEHFRASDVPLLARQVAAVAMCEHAAEKMAKSGGPVVDGKINPVFCRAAFRKTRSSPSNTVAVCRRNRAAIREPSPIRRIVLVFTIR